MLSGNVTAFATVKLQSLVVFVPALSVNTTRTVCVLPGANVPAGSNVPTTPLAFGVNVACDVTSTSSKRIVAPAGVVVPFTTVARTTASPRALAPTGELFAIYAGAAAEVVGT